MSDHEEYEEYTNQGKGLVLPVSGSLQAQVLDLFKEGEVYASADLDARIGWQFSQAVFYLRQKGHKIVTLHKKGTREYFYRYDGKQDGPVRAVRETI